MSIHLFEDSLSAYLRTPVSAQLGLVCECVQGKGDTTKKKGEKRHTKNKREREEREREERERERDDFLVLCDHEDGDGWDDREE